MIFEINAIEQIVMVILIDDVWSALELSSKHIEFDVVDVAAGTVLEVDQLELSILESSIGYSVTCHSAISLELAVTDVAAIASRATGQAVLRNVSRHHPQHGEEFIPDTGWPG